MNRHLQPLRRNFAILYVLTPCPLFAKQPADSAENAVLFGIVGVFFAGNLEYGWEGRRIGIDAMPYLVCDLRRVLSYDTPETQMAPHTCWLIKTIPISFLSVVKRSNADSMAALSVLLSTTKKFFWLSGGDVTCC
jgi:hypothetical protein